MQRSFPARLFRWFLPVILSALLLWVASPLLSGKQRGSTESPQMAKKYRQLQNQKLCRDHLQWLNLVMTAYEREYDGHLPALGNYTKFREQVQRYPKIPGGCVICPLSDKDYNANKNLAGKKISSIKDKTKTLLFWSSGTTAKGTYMALTADGHIHEVTGGQLNAFKR